MGDDREDPSTDNEYDTSDVLFLLGITFLAISTMTIIIIPGGILDTSQRSTNTYCSENKCYNFQNHTEVEDVVLEEQSIEVTLPSQPTYINENDSYPVTHLQLVYTDAEDSEPQLKRTKIAQETYIFFSVLGYRYGNYTLRLIHFDFDSQTIQKSKEIHIVLDEDVGVKATSNPKAQTQKG